MTESLQTSDNHGQYFDGFVTFEGEYIQPDDFEAKWAAWEREAELLSSNEREEMK